VVIGERLTWRRRQVERIGRVPRNHSGHGQPQDGSMTPFQIAGKPNNPETINRL
jgi:hypothetical protein